MAKKGLNIYGDTEIDASKISLEELNKIPDIKIGDFSFSDLTANIKGTDSKYYDDPNILHTEQEIEDIKARRQSALDSLANNTIAFGAKTAGNLVGGVGYTIGLVNGIGQSVARGFDKDGFKISNIDLQVEDFTENPLIHFNEAVDSWVEKEVPNYDSQDEQNNPLALGNIMGTIGNSLSRDAAPFMAAFMIEGAALGKLLGTPAKLAKLRAIAESGGNVMQTLPTGAMKKFLATADQKVIRELMIAQESLLEAHHGSDEVKNDFYSQAGYDGVPEEEIPEEVRNKASELQEDAFKNIALINTVALRLGNVEMKSLFRPSLSSRRPYEELAKSWNEASGLIGKAGIVAKQTGKLLSSEPVKESAEEVLQGAGASAVKEKIAKDREGYEIGDALTAGIDTLFGAVKRLSTNEGKLEVLTSMLLSGPMTIRNAIRDNKDTRDNAEFRKGALESDVSDLYKNNLAENTTGKNYETKLTDKGKEILNKSKNFAETEILKHASTAVNDKSTYSIVNDTQIANIGFTHFEAGLGEELFNKVDKIAEETAKELREQGKTKIFDFETGKEISIEEHTVKLKAKLQSYEDIYNSLETNYGFTDPNIRSTVFNNTIHQSELRKKILNTPDAVGKNWLDYKNNLKTDKPDIDIVLGLSNEHNKLIDKTDVKSINKKIVLDGLLNDYKNYKNWLAEASQDQIIKNNESYKNKRSDSFYYDKLKENFDRLLNPKIQEKISEDKTKRDNAEPEKLITKDVISEVPPVQETVVPATETIIPPVESSVVVPVATSTILEDTKEPPESSLDFTLTSTEDLLKLIPKDQLPDLSIKDKKEQESMSEFLKDLKSEENKSKDVNISDNIDNVISEVDKKDKIEEQEDKKLYSSNFITFPFELVSDNVVEIDNITKETKFTEGGLESNKELLKLKAGDNVEIRIGFMNPKNKNSGLLNLEDFRTLTKRNPLVKDFAIRAFSNDIKLGGVKITEDGKEIFNNILENNINRILTDNVPIIKYKEGFIRQLFNNPPPVNYINKEVPFENRAYINKPSDVIGNTKDIVLVTTNDKGDIKYITKNQSLKLEKGRIKPGRVYLLLQHPSTGKVIPIATKGEYITEEAAKYITEQVEKAISIKDYPLLKTVNNISSEVLVVTKEEDINKGLYISKGKIYVKGKETPLKDLQKVLENTYSLLGSNLGINELNDRLRLNVPKASSTQFIFPKAIVDLSVFKTINETIENSKEQENVSTETAISEDVIIPKIDQIVLEDSSIDINNDNVKMEDSEDILNKEELLNKLLSKKDTFVKYLIEKGSASEKANLLLNNKLNIKNINNLEPTMLEHFLKCLR